ncbi:MAG: hypothetical protein LBU37_07390 [Tannerellaceae bacterium]|jgi:hypothetical protein|nr:hypothetical protein [Tannerellaceae bacterium]
MGLFKFGKHHSQTSSDTKKELETEGPLNIIIETPVMPPIQKEISDPLPPPPPEKKKEKKEEEDIADFFTVNIYDIFKYNPESAGKGKGANGHPAELFELELPELELSAFFKVEILRYENQRYDLVFASNTNEIGDRLKKFIDFSCKAFGPDFMRKGSFNANDLRDVPLGVFSRIWYGKARMENTSFTLTLTLYGITPGEQVTPY